MKLGGQVGLMTPTNCFDFGEDPNPDPTTTIFKVILHHWEIELKNDISHDISKMYWARYVLVDQALQGGGMCSTECPSN